jgi:3-deoxy-7-phosphoheptulonate synthase
MRSLSSPQSLKNNIALSEQALAFISQSRKQVQDILSGKDQRLLIIVGPCSIHDVKSGYEYALRLKSLSQKLSDSCFIVMRSYIEKSRTQNGWKGFLYDPYLDGKSSLEEGIYISRKFLKDLAELNIPLAMEFVSPLASVYFDDLITWGCIGARTCSSQIHRQLASFLPMPIGFKNGLDGNLETAVHGMLVASQKQTFFHVNEQAALCEIQSKGNLFTHLILRGSWEGPNYDANGLKAALNLLQEFELPNGLMIDCSHGNCRKQFQNQISVFEQVRDYIEEGRFPIKGLMLESYLEAGSQPLSLSASPHVSITDPCLDWDSTEALLSSIDSSVVSSSSRRMSFTQS